MKVPFFEEHWSDADGNPAGGTSWGPGMSLSWQNGPLGRGETRQPPNGCFVETVIQAVIGRLKFYQASRFACEANADAIAFLEEAARILDRRTQDREAREVEGTHQL